MFTELQKKKSIKTVFPDFIHTYDFVHILKNIRNNWLNLKDYDKTFVYPDFESNDLRFAKCQDLRDLYRKECGNLLKLGSKLNYKTVFPTNLERQNVTLVCNIFHESTVAALNEIKSNEGSIFFLQLIYKWWSIVNIKSPWKSTIIRNPLQAPFTCHDDNRLKFLEKFVIWVERRDQMNSQGKGGGLSKDTSEALRHSTLTILNLIKLSLEKFAGTVSYVLPGKFQTDNLERRFSSYRQLSGGNYNISVMQMLDAEKKLRIKSYLGIKSAKYGKLKFSPLVITEAFNCPEEDISSCVSFKYEEDVIKTYSETDDSDLSMSPVIYVSGYAARKIKRDTSCELCVSFLCGDTIENEYFEELNRGGLTVPSAEAIIISKRCSPLLILL